jgi:SH3-like domain-containing protein
VLKVAAITVSILLGLAFAMAVSRVDVASAQETPKASGLPLPRFVSLRSEEVNMRTGPGVQYPVDWVYKRRNMPVEVLAEFGTWRKVRDIQGTQGWVHQSLLSSNRWVTITGQARTLRRRADSSSPAVARIEPGAHAQVVECPEENGWCRMTAGGYEGWLRRVEVWGVYPRENIK